MQANQAGANQMEQYALQYKQQKKSRTQRRADDGHQMNVTLLEARRVSLRGTSLIENWNVPHGFVCKHFRSTPSPGLGKWRPQRIKDPYLKEWGSVSSRRTAKEVMLLR